MNPASAMSFALKKPGRSALVCALTGTDFAVVAVIAASAAERSRLRFVSIEALHFGTCFGSRDLSSTVIKFYAKTANRSFGSPAALAAPGLDYAANPASRSIHQ